MILFLDFDGVLHPITGSPPFKPDCMAVLSNILDAYPEIRIVITSSWREEKSLDELVSLLGEQIGSSVIGTTPIIDEAFMHNVRYHEALEYLKGSSLEHFPWFAIDDERGSYPDNVPVILTDRRSGLTSADVIKIKTLIEAIKPQ